MKEKVIVGMSGGVDSSVAAWLLKQQGYEVIGVTLCNWDEAHSGAEEPSAVRDAREVAKLLDIPLYVVNDREEFKQSVISNFISEYRNGRTPNPCIVCNRYVKWEVLLQKARELGADYIATGHYASVIRLENGRYTVKKAAHDRKDQTYALCALTQEQLSHTLMPLAEYDKTKVRTIAERIGLKVADKPDSQDICFVPDGDYGRFMEEYTGEVPLPGVFVDKQGKKLGVHKGISAYTIGQRKGLGLAMGKPVFVTEIRPETGEVVIGDHEDLFAAGLVASGVNLMSCEPPLSPVRLTAKIRYAHKASDCTAYTDEKGSLVVCFDEPQRAITPGQSVVLYDGALVVGSGRIERVVF